MVNKNFDREFCHFDGSPIKRGESILLMKDVIIEALINVYPDENIDGEEKYKRWSLAVRLNAGGNQTLLPEEIVLIKSLTGKAYGPLLVGPLFRYLNE